MTFHEVLLALRQKHVTNPRSDKETESASLITFDFREHTNCPVFSSCKHAATHDLDFSQEFTLSG